MKKIRLMIWAVFLFQQQKCLLDPDHRESLSEIQEKALIDELCSSEALVLLTSQIIFKKRKRILFSSEYNKRLV